MNSRTQENEASRSVKEPVAELRSTADKCTQRCWMSLWTGGLLACHSPLSWVMLALLSYCSLCYSIVPFVPFCWGWVQFPHVLVHPRLR